jgi:hypothetical protein
VVTLSGRDFYLGKWNSPASRREYDRLIGEWLAGGRQVPTENHDDRTVAELLAAYWGFAKSYYRKNGRPTGELNEYRLTIRAVRHLYGPTPARDFGPRALKVIRQRMVDAGLCRGVVNQRIGRVKRIFKWAVAEELIPPAHYQALQALAGLRRGRTPARETEPVIGQFTRVTQTASQTVTLSATSAESAALCVFEIDDTDLTDGYNCVRVTVADTGAAGAQLGCLLYILSEPRHAAATMVSAIA